MSSLPKVVVLGSICRTPVPGIVFQMLHYLIGLERLGFEPYYVESHGNWVADPTNADEDADAPRVIIGDVLARYGFAERWVCRAPYRGDGAVYGSLTANDLPGLYEEAFAIFNISGAHHVEEEMKACHRRLYIETDPGIPQIRLAEKDEGMWNLVKGHTHFFTFGERVASGTSALPATGLPYAATRQPVVLDLWPPNGSEGGSAFTTVARWKKRRTKSVSWNGETYRWNKSDEFRRFEDLPRASGADFEIALSAADAEDVARLVRRGWQVRDAMASVNSMDSYRSFVRGSRAEFTVAKDQYVRFATGWFSDRSACYLAAGHPVVTQDTGIAETLPIGEGLLVFADMDEAVEAVRAVESDPERHAIAAARIAASHFDAIAVLTDMLNAVEITPPATPKPGGDQ